MVYRKFCFAFAAISIVALLLFAAFNIIVNPYDMWGYGKIRGFNIYSAKAEAIDRMQKPVAFLNLAAKPEAVFIGTSQCLYSLDMDFYKQLTSKEAYNFSLRGATMYEQRRSLEHIIANDDKLKEVYIGIVFEDFVDGEYYPLLKEEVSFEDNEEQYGRAYMTPQNFVRSALSWDAFKESVKKIADNCKHGYVHPFFMESGKVYDEHLMSYFQENQWKFNRTMAMMGRNGNYRRAKLNQESIDELKKILGLCQENGIEYHLFICPVHARQMELLAANWNAYEEWKREITAISPVMDFSGYNDITMSDSRPGVVDVDTNPYFWDVMHMNSRLGNRLIAALLGKDESPDGFGVMVTKENVDHNLAELKQGRELWEAKHPENIEEVRYYSGFSDMEPMDLREKKAIYANDSLIVERIGHEKIDKYNDWRTYFVKKGKGKQFGLQLPKEERIFVQGLRHKSAYELKNMYAILEREQGHRYYAMTEQMNIDAARLSLDSSLADFEEFYLKIPMWDIPPGEYKLSFVEVSAEGNIYQTDELGVVEVSEEDLAGSDIAI